MVCKLVNRFIEFWKANTSYGECKLLMDLSGDWLDQICFWDIFLEALGKMEWRGIDQEPRDTIT